MALPHGERMQYLTGQDFESIPGREIKGTVLETTPLASVLMLAFDHEAYIKEAIESVLSQKCDFPFELIIGEDRSRDKTRAICEDYQRRFPDKVRLIVSDENVGMHRNFARIWHRARGKYVAFLEGDDYWTDPEKLAKQIRLMEANPDFSMCGAYTEIIKQDEAGVWKAEGRVGPGVEKTSYLFEDLIPAYTFHFSSVMVRKEIVKFPRWLWDVYCGDRPLYLLCTEHGPAGFIPEVMSVYRHHTGGIWFPLSWKEKAERSKRLFETFIVHFNKKHAPLFRDALGDILWSYMAGALETKDSQSAKVIFKKSLKCLLPSTNIKQWQDIGVVSLRLYAPLFYRLFSKIKHRGEG